MSFVHLHNHTHYSLLDGLTNINELIAFAIEDGAPAVAITDHGVLYGAIEFYQKCQKAGIKPIIGFEAYVAPNSRLDKTLKEDERNTHLLLLAKNYEGYKNLIKLSTIAHLEGYYYKPRVDWESIVKYSKGIIASSACLAGEIPRLIQAGKIERAEQRAQEFNDVFGQDNFYLEIQSHPRLADQQVVNTELIRMSKKLNIPLLATNDMHYLKADDYDAQDVLLCLQTKRKKSDQDRMSMDGQDFYYKTAREMKEAFPDCPEALENTLKVAEACNLDLELGNTQLPHFELPEGEDKNSYLRHLCLLGLEKRYGKKYDELDEVRKTRMDYELSVIEKMGWPDYFLIVADFVNWAKDTGIVVGPGRGSAAGSLVCYLTGITNIDPIDYDLLFERFLNPERISMPDIDMDFADERREEVIHYVETKYGKNRVAQIITFGTMAARAAIRDVGRVLDYPYDFCDKLAKAIPMFSNISDALDSSSELKDLYQKEEGAKIIIDYAKRLEGVARHASTHACGVLITKDPLDEQVPLQFATSQGGEEKVLVSQYSLHPIEDLGLLKMDFLGLKNLTLIESALKIIKFTREINLDIDKIPLDDKDAYALFQKGETTGIFQFESSGMKRYLRELKPTDFEDIIAMVALYRPGPMEWIPDYIERKHGRKKVVYLHPKLEPILKKTHGVAIYQEQVMQIARDLAGFTMGEADVLRKAMGKKIPELLAKQREKFIDGSVKNGINKELAEKIFSFIEPFAGYGFNRSHAACYAMVAYQTAYLKAHWPAEFMAALLRSDEGDTDRMAIEIDECRNMGIEVLAPDVNQSFSSFTVVTSGTLTNTPAKPDEKVNTIRFGLKAVKNVGEHISDVIIEERKNNGVFKNLSDFLLRVLDKDLNKKSMESLVKAGAFDSFEDRGRLLSNMELILNFNKEASKEKESAQVSLFGATSAAPLSRDIRLKDAPEAGRQERLAWEKELMGLYITEHPFVDYKPYVSMFTTPLNKLSKDRVGIDVVISGMITSIKKIITRSNEPMAFVKIEDDTSSVECLVFPKLLKENPDLWQDGKAVICRGQVSNKDLDIKILAEKGFTLDIDNIATEIEKIKKEVTTASPPRFNRRPNGFGNNNYYSKKTAQEVAPAAKPENSAGVFLSFKESSLPNSEKLFIALKEIFARHPGKTKVFLKVKKDDGTESIVETDFKVLDDDEFKGELSAELRKGI